MNKESVAIATSRNDKNNKTKIQVIARAAALLRALEHEPDGLSLGVLAQRLQLPRSTVQRIVGALEAESLLIAASPAGRVKLGPALLRLSASAKTSVGIIAKPHMTELARELAETVDLSMMSRRHAIIVQQVVGQRPSGTTAAIADKLPLHCTAAGKSMLALLTDAEIEHEIGRRYPSYTEFTRTNLSALLSDIQQIRLTGLAYEEQEHTLGLCAIGVGFSDPMGNRLAFSIQIANARFEEIKDKAAERLLELRDSVIARLSSK